MKSLLLVLGTSLAFGGLHGAEPPATLMAVPTKLLVSEDFGGPLPPFTGTPVGFASGFQGWKFNSGPRGGRWEVKDSAFHGRELVEAKHPATASYGLRFRDAIVVCEARLEDQPLDGLTYRVFGIRLTDDQSYVATLRFSAAGPGTFGIEKSDNDGKGPDTAVSLGSARLPIALDQWHQIVFEIVGDEIVGTVDGKSLAGRHPLFAAEKHSVMFMIQSLGAVRNLRIWEAQPQPKASWPSERERLRAGESNGAPLERKRRELERKGTAK